jgi:hypothetical protein
VFYPDAPIPSSNVRKDAKYAPYIHYWVGPGSAVTVEGSPAPPAGTHRYIALVSKGARYLPPDSSRRHWRKNWNFNSSDVGDVTTFFITSSPSGRHLDNMSILDVGKLDKKALVKFCAKPLGILTDRDKKIYC